MFTLLQGLEVLTSDNMSRIVTIKQQNRTVSVPTETAFFHLEASDSHLKLYIPQNREHQQVCLFRHLPTRLLQHFGAPIRNRGAELGAIITATSVFVVDAILDQDGVIGIEGVCKTDTTETEDTIPEPNTNSELVVATSTLRDAVQRPSLHGTHDSGYFGESSWPGQGSEHNADGELIDGAERPDLFRQLIRFTIEQANLIESLPTKGSHVLATRSSEPLFDHRIAVDLGIDRNAQRKIGAIGELFVSFTDS